MIIKYNADSNLQPLVSGNVNFGHIYIATAQSDIPRVNMRNVRKSQLPVRSNFSKLLIAHRFKVKTKLNACNVQAECLLPNRDIIFIGSRKRAFNEQSLLIVYDCD